MLAAPKCKEWYRELRGIPNMVYKKDLDIIADPIKEARLSDGLSYDDPNPENFLWAREWALTSFKEI